jgi:hypothetical protein
VCLRDLIQRKECKSLRSLSAWPTRKLSNLKLRPEPADNGEMLSRVGPAESALSQMETVLQSAIRTMLLQRLHWVHPRASTIRLPAARPSRMA